VGWGCPAAIVSVAGNVRLRYTKATPLTHLADDLAV
jgi:hypothetical protein